MRNVEEIGDGLVLCLRTDGSDHRDVQNRRTTLRRTCMPPYGANADGIPIRRGRSPRPSRNRPHVGTLAPPPFVRHIARLADTRLLELRLPQTHVIPHIGAAKQAAL